MYDNLFNAAGSDTRSAKAVRYHDGTSRQYRRRCLQKICKAVGEGKKGVEEIAPHLIHYVCEPKMLREAWNDLARHKKASQPTGRLSFDHFDNKEVWELLTFVSEGIRLGAFRPGPMRKRAIPKDRSDPARGTRTISESNPEDRAVERNISLVLRPLVEAGFPDGILGFRQGKDRVDALAYAYQLAQDQNRFVWVAEDIRDAFDNVPRKELMQVVAKYVPSVEVVSLIERFVFREPGKRGISQGGPLSPLLLNLYVFHFLERVWEKKGVAGVPILRVADDLLLLGRDKYEAEAAWNALNDLLSKAGLPLKHGREKAVTNLSTGCSATWLGYRIFRGQAGFETKIAKKSWGRLKHHLEMAHEKADSPLRAIDAINGWLDQLGPCYANVNLSRELMRIEQVAACYGFDEIPCRDALRFRWLSAHLRWKKRFHPVEAASVPAKSPESPGLCVDAAWSRKRKELEYQGVWLKDGKSAFQSGPYKTGSNNIGEFLAIVRGMQLLTKQGLNCPIYSDSQTAIKWIEERQVRSSTASLGDLSSKMYRRLTRALLWLDRNRPMIPVVKWDTDQQGEIPADYGRK